MPSIFYMSESRPPRVRRHDPAITTTGNEGWVPHCPDFLQRLVALIHSMRLSLMKGAHADLSSTAWRKSGSSPVLACWDSTDLDPESGPCGTPVVLRAHVNLHSGVPNPQGTSGMRRNPPGFVSLSDQPVTTLKSLIATDVVLSAPGTAKPETTP